MNLRFRILITAACVCHLLFTTPVVTSQLRSPSTTQYPSAAGLQSPELQLELPPYKRTCNGTITHVHAPGQRDETVIQACEQERANGVYTANGDVVITHRNYILYADHATYDPQTGNASATGHVILDGGPNDEHLEATHGTYNVRTDTGTFYDVKGTIGMQFHGRQVTLTTSNPFALTGRVVNKVGPDRYVVHHGTVTSCQVPHPKWTFHSSRVVVEVGGEAKIYNGNFRIKGIPTFYLPYATHPVDHLGRHSGFLMPSFGTSNIKGTILGDSYYWAINRSADATLGAEYYSSRGWTQHGNFRAVPNDHTYIRATYFGVTDRGYRLKPGFGAACVELVNRLCKQGGEDFKGGGSTSFGNGIRAVGNLEYLSSFIFRLAFNYQFSEAVVSEVSSNAFLSKNFNGYSANALVERYQDFQSAIPNDIVTIRHTPSIDFSSVDRQLGHSPLYWSFDSEVAGLSREVPTAVTAAGVSFFRTAPVVGRFDLHPDVSLPFQLHGWDFRPEIALRDTAYSESLTPVAGTVGATSSEPINRKAVEGTFELRPPALSRIFGREMFRHKFKHVVEPGLTYRYVAGVDNFNDILRFDERDVLTNTNEIEYGVTNRLYAKPTRTEDQDCALQPTNPAKPEVSKQQPQTSNAGRENTPAAGKYAGASASVTTAQKECEPPVARELVTWRIAQKHFFNPTFGGAVVAGRPNVFTTTADFTGIAFLTAPANYSPVISRLRFQGGPADAEWDLDYDIQKGRINSSNAMLGYTLGQFSLAGSHAFLQSPGETLPTASVLSLPLKFNQWRLLARYGNPNRRGFNVAASIGMDANLNVLQFSVYQATYNWDCCGLTFEMRRWALGPVRNENQFRFAFSLANVGTFGNLRRTERLF